MFLVVRARGNDHGIRRRRYVGVLGLIELVTAYSWLAADRACHFRNANRDIIGFLSQAESEEAGDEHVAVLRYKASSKRGFRPKPEPPDVANVWAPVR